MLLIALNLDPKIIFVSIQKCQDLLVKRDNKNRKMQNIEVELNNTVNAEKRAQDMDLGK